MAENIMPIADDGNFSLNRAVIRRMMATKVYDKLIKCDVFSVVLPCIRDICGGK